MLANGGNSGHAKGVNHPNIPDTAARDAILALCRARGTAKSICPTEAARLLSGDRQDESWQAVLPRVRRAALQLAEAGVIDILRKGKPVAPEAAHGVVRLRLRAETDETGGTC